MRSGLAGQPVEKDVAEFEETESEEVDLKKWEMKILISTVDEDKQDADQPVRVAENPLTSYPVSSSSHLHHFDEVTFAVGVQTSAALVAAVIAVAAVEVYSSGAITAAVSAAADIDV